MSMNWNDIQCLLNDLFEDLSEEDKVALKRAHEDALEYARELYRRAHEQGN